VKVSVLTGAGISAESGLPTFRDKGERLWAKFNPMEWQLQLPLKHSRRRFMNFTICAAACFKRS